MVGRRRSHGRQLSSSHQRSWLWGRHAVQESLSAGEWRPLELRLADRLDAALLAAVSESAASHGVSLTVHPFEKLTNWCGTTEHQGLLALMPPYPYQTLEQALAQCRRPELLLLLNRIQDPHNFGAMLRSAEVFGVDAVIVGRREQCDVTPHVVRSSAGAVHHLRICQVDDPVAALGRCRELAAAEPTAQPLQTVAAVGTAEATAEEIDFRQPTLLVIGNEGSGVSAELQAACGHRVRIPQVGQIESLNASVATGVLLYEVRRQRDAHS